MRHLLHSNLFWWLMMVLLAMGILRCLGGCTANMNNVATPQAVLRTRFEAKCMTADDQYRTDLTDAEWQSCKDAKAAYCEAYPQDCKGVE